MAKVDVYEEVTNKVIEALESGTIPWHKPWATTDGVLPRNFVSKKPYRGINIFLLAMTPYSAPYWMTFKQAAEVGFQQWRKTESLKDDDAARAQYKDLPVEDRGGVRKGEKATMITFWKMVPNKGYKPDEKGSQKTIPMLRYFNVFNVEQMQNIDYPKPELTDPKEFNPIADAEALLENYEGPEVVVGGNRASYSPKLDVIHMPQAEQFDDAEGYYATLFHESVHSTGHKDRLNRPELVKAVGFGTDEYSKEELVAEMGAAMLCNVVGLSPATIDNTAAYIKSWISKLKDDKKMLISAAGKAQKAADLVQGITQEEKVA